MSRAIPGRPRRKRGVPRVPLRARVEPETLDRVYAVAEVLGVSLTAYVEELIRHDQLDEHGRPVWWTAPIPSDQEELPLSKSA
jgi:hypothetical protein